MSTQGMSTDIDIQIDIESFEPPALGKKGRNETHDEICTLEFLICIFLISQLLISLPYGVGM